MHPFNIQVNSIMPFYVWRNVFYYLRYILLIVYNTMYLNINNTFLRNNNYYCIRNYALKISFQNEGIILLNILVDCSGHRYMDGICPPLCNIIDVFQFGRKHLFYLSGFNKIRHLGGSFIYYLFYGLQNREINLVKSIESI
jgi:hypothetical protein